MQQLDKLAVKLKAILSHHLVEEFLLHHLAEEILSHHLVEEHLWESNQEM